MLNKGEYIGFAIRRPDEDGAIVFVFDVVSDVLVVHGGYKMLGETEKQTNLDDASILIVSLRDGTMPITIDDFSERVRNGDTTEQNINIFIRAEMIGKVEFNDPSVREALDAGDNAAFRMMFYQCADCLQAVDGPPKPVKKPRKAKQKRKS